MDFYLSGWDFCAQLVVQFFLYAVAGWCMEVILKYIQFHRFINRGFLIGPYCPIYGAGAVLLTVVIGGSIGSYASYFLTFVVGFVVCGALEYFVSWYMEKMFHARWWDYSQKPMNLHGRIWIGNLILFGLGGIVIVKWLNPPMFQWMDGWPLEVLRGAAIVVIVIMIGDNIASHMMFGLVKTEIDGIDADNSEEVSTKVRALLKNKSLLVRRIGEAYPNLKVQPDVILKNMKRRQEQMMAAMKEQGEQMLDAVKEQSEQVLDAMKEQKEQVLETVKEQKEQVLDAVKEQKEQVLETVKEQKEQVFETVKEQKEQMLDAVKEQKEQVLETVKEQKEQMLDAVQEKKEQTIDRMKEKTDKTLEAVKEKSEEISEQMKEKLRS